jgi:hypothetical protein
MISEETKEQAEILDKKIYNLIEEMEEFDQMYTLIRLSQTYCMILQKIRNSGETGEQLLELVNKDIIEEHGYKIVPLEQTIRMGSQPKHVDPMFM